jgi:hypothetical protein
MVQTEYGDGTLCTDAGRLGNEGSTGMTVSLHGESREDEVREKDE